MAQRRPRADERKPVKEEQATRTGRLLLFYRRATTSELQKQKRRMFSHSPYGWVSYLHRAATTYYLCCGQALEDSQGAGRIGLTHILVKSIQISKAAMHCRIQPQKRTAAGHNTSPNDTLQQVQDISASVYVCKGIVFFSLTKHNGQIISAHTIFDRPDTPLSCHHPNQQPNHTMQ